MLLGTLRWTNIKRTTWRWCSTLHETWDMHRTDLPKSKLETWVHPHLNPAFLRVILRLTYPFLNLRETHMPQLNWKHLTWYPQNSCQLLRLEKVGARTVRSPLMTFFRWDMALHRRGPFSMNGLLPENAQFQKTRGWVELLNTWSTELKCVKNIYA